MGEVTKRMLGSYEEADDALNAIDVYQLGGHESNNIVIFANETHADSLQERTQTQVKTDNPNPVETPGMMQKIKDALSTTDDFELDTTEKLIAYGLSQEEAEKALFNVQMGHIVVLADDELRMGHKEM